MHKSRSSYRDGYKAHVAVEPSTGLITACDLTPANEGDGPTGIKLLANEPDSLDVLADSAYGSGDSLAALDDAEHRILIKPWPLARNSKLGDDQFDRDDFSIDYIARTVTCPNGNTTHITDKGSATFGTKCRGCPVRSRCTSAIDGRTFLVGEHDEHLAANRLRWRTDTDLVDDYRQHRPMVERTIAWLVTNGHRRVRHHGVARNKIAFSTRAAVVNLKRSAPADRLAPSGRSTGVDEHRSPWARRVTAGRRRCRCRRCRCLGCRCLRCRPPPWWRRGRSSRARTAARSTVVRSPSRRAR